MPTYACKKCGQDFECFPWENNGKCAACTAPQPDLSDRSEDPDPWKATAKSRSPRLWRMGESLAGYGRSYRVVGWLAVAGGVVYCLSGIGGDESGRVRIMVGASAACGSFGLVFLGVVLSAAGEAAHALARIVLNTERTAEAFRPSDSKDDAPPTQVTTPR